MLHRWVDRNWAWVAILAGALAGVLAACGDDLVPVGPDAGAAPDGAPLDAPGASVDAAVAACAEPPASAVIGSAGGEVTLCGARLTVAPGVLVDPIEFAIAAEIAPAPAPPRELAGPAFRFTAGGSARLPAPVEIAVPHGGRAGRIELFAVEDGELFGLEACTVDDEIIGQLVGLLGTFVATVDPYPYADSPADLGSGSVSAAIGERDAAYSIPDDGYVIDQAWGEPVALSLVTDILDGPDGPEQLRFDAAIADGEATLLFAQWYAGGVIWQLGTPDNPGTTGTIDVDTSRGDRLVGSMSGSLYAGEDTISFAAELDLTPVYWVFPPERFCPGGKKPPG